MSSTLHLRNLNPRTLIRTAQTTTTPSLHRPFHQTVPRLVPAVKQEADKPPPEETQKKSKKGGAPQPKISNLSMPGVNKSEELTKEQKEEVRKHNEDFEKKFDHGQTAPQDKIDEKFWEGGQGLQQGRKGIISRVTI
ncbi:hypothetical protein BBK36DRAFT_19480 [Trichoderma citrinoviride]|uniref:Uncharacterized protein n=1 Tax=Trichoderma citrinoviride TaxID=58853 RepID=A0A2T4BC24_9HYPO|nr:hypothetical protein BBK36DRAFT_19480 [Trichoderma citrinoviride]PTB66865.1 hypothetical protein BBK36DRAFT_19480 [Trichoderma citrinoviride]